MSSNFVPFATQGVKGLTTPHSAEAPVGFKPLGGFRPSAAPARLPLPEASVAPEPTAAGSTAPCAAEPTLTLKREGERVTQIQIRCTCGQVIELHCVY
jgi:hypothetical protein